MFAAGLSSMFEIMDINEDCYGLGYISKLVASELANLPSARVRRKVGTFISAADSFIVHIIIWYFGVCSFRIDSWTLHYVSVQCWVCLDLKVFLQATLRKINHQTPIHSVSYAQVNKFVFWNYLLQTASGRASLVLIDRTLDLVGPCAHTGDTLADRIINLLPRLPYHKVDVAVDMARLCASGRCEVIMCCLSSHLLLKYSD